MAQQGKHALLLAAEGTGDTLALVTWVAFGAGVVGQTMGYLSWSVLLYAVLSLTLIRMLPVYLSLRGLPLRPDAKLFIGWFGPRGLASIVFVILVFAADLPGGDTLMVTVVCTIVLSILLHGFYRQSAGGCLRKSLAPRRGGQMSARGAITVIASTRIVSDCISTRLSVVLAKGKAVVQSSRRFLRCHATFSCLFPLGFAFVTVEFLQFAR